MKAAVRSKYGTAEVLHIQEVHKPTPADNEVLIRVYAASVNRSDYHMLTGLPLPMRIYSQGFQTQIILFVQIFFYINIISTRMNHSDGPSGLKA